MSVLLRRAEGGICERWSPMKVAIKKTVKKQSADLSPICYMVGSNLLQILHQENQPPI